MVVDDLRRFDLRMVQGVAALLGTMPVHESVDVTDVEALSGVFATHGPFDAGDLLKRDRTTWQQCLPARRLVAIRR